MDNYCKHIWLMLTCCIALINFTALAQNQNLSLEICQSKAVDNFPLIKQYNLLDASEEYTLSNLSKNYLPQVIFNAQATYQSAVTKVPISVPGMNIEPLSRDQYRAMLDVNQLIWDGGATNAQKKMSKAGTEVERKRTEVNIYAIRDRINQLYFGILSVDEQLKQLEIMNNDLHNSFNMVEAMIKNGIAIESDLDRIKVEQLNLEQMRTELRFMRKAQLEILSTMINEPINNDCNFAQPEEYTVQSEPTINRPELQLFDMQRNMIESRNELVSAKNKPKVSLFAQGGYGRPGLNMLSNNFELFGIGGVRMTWNLGALYTRKNDRQLIQLDKDNVTLTEDMFLYNTNLQLKQAYKEVEKARELEKTDDAIIELRAKVKLAGESKYKQGVYTINDYLRDINAENKARQTKAIHRIQYFWSAYNYRTIEGY